MWTLVAAGRGHRATGPPLLRPWIGPVAAETNGHKLRARPRDIYSLTVLVARRPESGPFLLRLEGQPFSHRRLVPGSCLRSPACASITSVSASVATWPPVCLCPNSPSFLLRRHQPLALGAPDPRCLHLNLVTSATAQFPAKVPFTGSRH